MGMAFWRWGKKEKGNLSYSQIWQLLLLCVHSLEYSSQWVLDPWPRTDDETPSLFPRHRYRCHSAPTAHLDPQPLTTSYNSSWALQLIFHRDEFSAWAFPSSCRWYFSEVRHSSASRWHCDVQFRVIFSCQSESVVRISILSVSVAVDVDLSCNCKRKNENRLRWWIKIMAIISKKWVKVFTIYHHPDFFLASICICHGPSLSLAPGCDSSFVFDGCRCCLDCCRTISSSYGTRTFDDNKFPRPIATRRSRRFSSCFHFHDCDGNSCAYQMKMWSFSYPLYRLASRSWQSLSSLWDL